MIYQRHCRCGYYGHRMTALYARLGNQGQDKVLVGHYCPRCKSIYPAEGIRVKNAAGHEVKLEEPEEP